MGILARGTAGWLVAWLGLGLLASCGDKRDRGACTDEVCLRAALSDARAGDTVTLAAGAFEGAFTLPAGVRLLGAGEDKTVLKFLGEGPVLDAPVAEGLTTTIQDLSVAAGAGGGILSQGTCGSGGASFALADVSISITGGVGLQVQEACSVKVDNLSISGNVDESNKNGIPLDPDKTRYAVVGVALIKVGYAELNQLVSRGFAAYGVVLYETSTVWDGGEVHELVGTGIQADGGSQDANEIVVTLKNLRVHHVWKGATPYGFGVLASNGVHLVTENVTIEDNDTAGLMMDHATGEHTTSILRKNKNRGVWLQYCDLPRAGEIETVIFSGTDTELDDNQGVAVGIYRSKKILLSDGSIHDILRAPMPTEGGGSTEIGDGIEIFESDELTFTDLAIENCARAGIVVDGGTQGATSATFTNVRISGNGDRGFVVQNGTVTSSPNVITEALQQADLIGGPLDVAAVVGIENLPDPQNIIDIEH